MKVENEIKRLGGFYGQATRWGVYEPRYIAPTLTASAGCGGGHIVMILLRKKNNDSKNKN